LSKILVKVISNVYPVKVALVTKVKVLKKPKIDIKGLVDRANATAKKEEAVISKGEALIKDVEDKKPEEEATPAPATE